MDDFGVETKFESSTGNDNGLYYLEDDNQDTAGGRQANANDPSVDASTNARAEDGVATDDEDAPDQQAPPKDDDDDDDDDDDVDVILDAPRTPHKVYIRPGVNTAAQAKPSVGMFGNKGVPAPFTGSGSAPNIPNFKSAYEIDLDELEEKPWQKPGANLQAWFNYGFNEDTWREYCAKQRQIRLETKLQSKIQVFDSSTPAPGSVPLAQRENNNSNNNNTNNTNNSNHSQPPRDNSAPTPTPPVAPPSARAPDNQPPPHPGPPFPMDQAQRRPPMSGRPPAFPGPGGGPPGMPPPHDQRAQMMMQGFGPGGFGRGAPIEPGRFMDGPRRYDNMVPPEFAGMNMGGMGMGMGGPEVMGGIGMGRGMMGMGMGMGMGGRGMGPMGEGRGRGRGMEGMWADGMHDRRMGIGGPHPPPFLQPVHPMRHNPSMPGDMHQDIADGGPQGIADDAGDSMIELGGAGPPQSSRPPSAPSSSRPSNSNTPSTPPEDDSSHSSRSRHSRSDKDRPRDRERDRDREREKDRDRERERDREKEKDKDKDKGDRSRSSSSDHKKSDRDRSRKESGERRPSTSSSRHDSHTPSLSTDKPGSSSSTSKRKRDDESPGSPVHSSSSDDKHKRRK